MPAKTCYCWKCHAQLGELLLPLSRTEQCKQCRAQLHVCRMCEFYDTSVADQCREPVAEKVQDKTRANFCGYFQISDRPVADTGPALNGESLEALFDLEPGSVSGERDTPEAQLDALFGLDDKAK